MPKQPGSLTETESLTPRQRELAAMLAALLVADYRAFPTPTVSSPRGLHRAGIEDADPLERSICAR
jgi:hypothetical protein